MSTDGNWQQLLSRRGFLGNINTGLAGIGTAHLLRGMAPASAPQMPIPGQTTHFPPKATQVLQIFCPGAASHMDLWDHKPALTKHDTFQRPNSVAGGTRTLVE